MNVNTTIYSYADNFFTDTVDTSNPSPYTPTKLTNAYLKTITSPTVGGSSLVTTFGYYWGTGQKASSSDPNGQTTISHFYDLMSRPTSIKLPNGSPYGGWTYSVYPSASETQVDVGTGITSSTLSTSCAGVGDCRHDQAQLDGLGRTSSKILVSDPDGQTTVATAYDSNGRVLKVSNPYRGSGPIYWETYGYEGMDRKTQVTRLGPDPSIVGHVLQSGRLKRPE